MYIECYYMNIIMHFALCMAQYAMTLPHVRDKTVDWGSCAVKDFIKTIDVFFHLLHSSYYITDQFYLRVYFQRDFKYYIGPGHISPVEATENATLKYVSQSLT